MIEELGLEQSAAGLVSQISVEQPLDTVLIKITARDASPQGAQRLADAWVEALAAEVDEIEDPKGLDRPGTPQVTTVESAVLPSTPVSPDPVRNLGLALLIGLVLGYAYALLRHTLDRRLRTPQAVQERFEVPVLGMVPMAPALGRDPDEGAAVAVDDSDANPRQRQAAEAFRKLRTNLIFMRVDDPPKVIVVTSPQPGDGKSTVAANLAAAVAYSGQPVTLVDGDLRRPTVATSMQVDGDVGLTDVLVGRVTTSDAVQKSTVHPNLGVLAAGRIPPNPSELLGSQAMKSTLSALAATSLVIVDAPPLLPVTDAAILTAGADGALVVISAGRTVDAELSQALSHLEAVSGTALGVIMNKTSRRGMSGYYYETYYYGEDQSRRRKRSKKAKRSAGRRGPATA
ncbi:polysaccharide biosynthesis tyrosine autokinase [Nocardioides sp. SOB77]|uniref:Polysaccharide biosynthesis tyrosine autokinase n=1 Tax=Nocardioides oceani TaxID=3058369 RepID=A0ABT8FK32_9ACTN|nr:polysaccharide biosynthesis tyrosine autokinase [Nocardioides oceani]MDN4174507.1 polysaccharide biosynthesis tyrosine autokinase [Nocardioides oceani]